MLNFIFNHIYILVFQQNACQNKKTQCVVKKRKKRTSSASAAIAAINEREMKENCDRTETEFEREREN